MNILNLKRDEFLIQNIVSHCQIWEDNESYSYLKRKRPDNGFAVITHGKTAYTDKAGRTVNASHRDIVFIPKDSEYKVVFSTVEGMNYANNLIVNFSVKDMCGNEIELSDRIELLGRDAEGRICRIISEMPELYRKNESLLLKSRFYLLVNEIINIIINDSADGMTAVFRYIENNICSAISIANLARLCSMSESSFRKQFKNITGVSPIKYINNLKVNKAKELLSSSGISVEEISDFLSFYDKSYFYKVFKETVGMTPIQYKNKSENLK